MSARVGLQAFVAGCTGHPGRFHQDSGSCGDLRGSARCVAVQPCCRAPLVCHGAWGWASLLLLVWDWVLCAGNAMLPTQGKPETAQMQFWQWPPRAWGQAAGAVPERLWAAVWGPGQWRVGAAAQCLDQTAQGNWLCLPRAGSYRDQRLLKPRAGLRKHFLHAGKELENCMLTTPSKRAELV